MNNEGTKTKKRDEDGDGADGESDGYGDEGEEECRNNMPNSNQADCPDYFR